MKTQFNHVYFFPIFLLKHDFIFQ